VFGPEVAGLVGEVTDDKSLLKAERKRLQIELAGSKSSRGRLIKIADKVSNLNTIVRSPPTEWSKECKREYFQWAAAVVAGCRGINSHLDEAFDRVYAQGIAMLAAGAE
jgi:guanosine-3',5'-bis(diphosphate) 3'-pyrophosphohydrolase